METATPAAGSSPAPAVTPAAPANTPAPAAPATPVVTATPAATALKGPTARDVASVLSSAERKQVATGSKTVAQVLAARPGAAAPAAAPAPAAVAPVVAEPPAAPAIAEPAPVAPAQTDAPEITPAPASDDDAKQPDRFRFKDEADRAVALLAKTKGISLVEAARLYAGEASAAPATPATPAAPAAPVAPAVDPELARYDAHLGELNTKLKTLSDQRKQARDEVDNEKADSLSDEIADLRTQIGLLTNERQGHVRNSEQAVARTHEQKANASRDRLLATYTELATEGSLHRLALDSYVASALADPKRAALFNDPTWPEKLGEEFAQTHGLKKKGAASAAPAPVAPTVTPAVVSPAAALLRPKVVQVPGAKGLSSADGTNPSGANAPTKEQLMADLRRMTPEQRKAAVALIPRTVRTA